MSRFLSLRAAETSRRSVTDDGAGARPTNAGASRAPLRGRTDGATQPRRAQPPEPPIPRSFAPGLLREQREPRLLGCGSLPSRSLLPQLRSPHLPVPPCPELPPPPLPFPMCGPEPPRHVWGQIESSGPREGVRDRRTFQLQHCGASPGSHVSSWGTTARCSQPSSTQLRHRLLPEEEGGNPRTSRDGSAHQLQD